MSCASGQKEDVDLAVEAARNALDNSEWTKMNGAARQSLMNKYADLLVQNADEIAWIEGTDNGKSLANATRDVHMAAAIFRYNAGLADTIEGMSVPRDD